MDILWYILVTIVSIAISPLLKGLVNKFVEEDEIEEREASKQANNKKNKEDKITIYNSKYLSL